MQRAQRLLRAGNAGIAQIAAQVGYQTEPAFGRAFKHWAGIAPGAYPPRQIASASPGSDQDPSAARIPISPDAGHHAMEEPHDP
jgi:AraC-like DNA-binding protein